METENNHKPSRVKIYRQDIQAVGANVAPIQGRKNIEQLTQRFSTGITWGVEAFSISGNLNKPQGSQKSREPNSLHVNCQLDIEKNAVKNAEFFTWVEFELTNAKHKGSILTDLFQVGNRPLPVDNLTCISRHPWLNQCYLAGSAEGQLLTLDGDITNNLQILHKLDLPGSIHALIPCGRYLLAHLETGKNSCRVLALGPDPAGNPWSFQPEAMYYIPQPLVDLAENDDTTFWGLTSKGKVYLIGLNQVQGSRKTEGNLRSTLSLQVKSSISLDRGMAKLRKYLHAFRGKNSQGLVFDGDHFWIFCQNKNKPGFGFLSVYNQRGNYLRSFFMQTKTAMSYLAYQRSSLLVLDGVNQQLYLYQIADAMQSVASLPIVDLQVDPQTPGNLELSKLFRVNTWEPEGQNSAKVDMHEIFRRPIQHPGFLEAGKEKSRGMHNMCLLYVGGEGKKQVHRYDQKKLRPVVGYLDPEGNILDHFMDGFLVLAQYSPLLNGRPFGLDLKGEGSHKEDWLALFKEYFSLNSNLEALEEAVAEVKRALGTDDFQAKVVLAIPAADSRVVDWDGEGLSLASPENRLWVTQWAMEELSQRWKDANYQHLLLAGFYYMTEQGAWQDPVLQEFPQLCRNLGYASYAIPGITSTFLTEFRRAGFDCVSFQPSHAFWQKPMRPKGYLLKCAGQIAREYQMGMVIELPYNIENPKEIQKVYDYLDMAQIQGWAGAFKAYFQSFNLIYTLWSSENSEAKALYTDLYLLSRISRVRTQYGETQDTHLPESFGLNYQKELQLPYSKSKFRLNVAGNPGHFKVKQLWIE